MIFFPWFHAPNLPRYSWNMLNNDEKIRHKLFNLVLSSPCSSKYSSGADRGFQVKGGALTYKVTIQFSLCKVNFSRYTNYTEDNLFVYIKKIIVTNFNKLLSEHSIYWYANVFVYKILYFPNQGPWRADTTFIISNDLYIYLFLWNLHGFSLIYKVTF
jgi:hypothetical protein